MLGRRKKARRITLGADKAYDVAEFVDALREGAVTPHIAVGGHVRKTGKPRKTRVDRRTTRHPGYAASQRLRKRIEEGFGWIMTTGGLAKTRHRRLDRVGWMYKLAGHGLALLLACLARGPEGVPRAPRAGRHPGTWGCQRSGRRRRRCRRQGPMPACHGGIYFTARGIIILVRAPLIGWVLHVAPGGFPDGPAGHRRCVRNPMYEGRRYGGPPHGRERRMRHDISERRGRDGPPWARCLPDPDARRASEVVEDGALAIPRGGYLLRRGRGRIIVEAARR